LPGEDRPTRVPLATNLAWSSASACNSTAYISDKQKGWLTVLSASDLWSCATEAPARAALVRPGRPAQPGPQYSRLPERGARQVIRPSPPCEASSSMRLKQCNDSASRFFGFFFFPIFLTFPPAKKKVGPPPGKLRQGKQCSAGGAQFRNDVAYPRHGS
jgi:hypothetical protein